MFQPFLMSGATALILAIAGGSASAQTLITGTLTDDRYVGPNPPVSISNGTRDLAPLFAFYKDETTTFFFNSHYSSLIMKWNLELPVELTGQTLTVTSASLVLWHRANAGGWVPGTSDIKLFATGVTGDNGFTTSTWTEARTYIGPGSASATPLQDPYMIELGTGNRAEDNLAAVPWALGQADPSYDGSAIPAEAVPVTFQLDVNNPEISAKLISDLQAGFALWTVASTYYASEPGTGTPTEYPRFVTKEGVANTAYGTTQQAPTLRIEVAPLASVADWTLY